MAYMIITSINSIESDNYPTHILRVFEDDLQSSNYIEIHDFS